MLPKAIVYTKAEARNNPRGQIKVAVEKDTGLVAFGWLDGNPVHFLTTADGTDLSSVVRRVKDRQRRIKAPSAIRKYNHGMQAVDRFDQLVSLYAMAKRHSFKKYYNKLTMALVDIALVNAEIHFFLANPDLKKGNHRSNFRTALSDELFNIDWMNYQNETPLLDGELTWEGTETPTCNVGGKHTPVKSCYSPAPISKFVKARGAGEGLSYEGLCCQVCSFEGRKRKSRHVVFCDHGIRACLDTPKSDSSTPISIKIAECLDKGGSLDSWLCPERNSSCYSKLHSFYIPMGLFGNDPVAVFDCNQMPKTKSTKRKSSVYSAKMDFMFSVGLLTKKRAPPLRKKANPDEEERNAKKPEPNRGKHNSVEPDLQEGYDLEMADKDVLQSACI